MSAGQALEQVQERIRAGLLSDFDSLHRVASKPAYTTFQPVKRALEQAVQAKDDFCQPFLMVVLGGFSAGKSTIINTLAGEPLCKTAVRPTTDRLQELFIPSLGNWKVIDTPGTNATLREDHKEAALAAARRANLALLVLNAEQPLGESDVPIFRELLAANPRVIVALNRWNHLETAHDREDALNYVYETLPNVLPGKKLHVITMDARKADDLGVQDLRDTLMGHRSDSDFAWQQKVASARAAIRRDGSVVIEGLKSFLQKEHEAHEQKQAVFSSRQDKAKGEERHVNEKLSSSNTRLLELVASKNDVQGARDRDAVFLDSLTEGAAAGAIGGPVGAVLGMLGGAILSGLQNLKNDELKRGIVDKLEKQISEHKKDIEQLRSDLELCSDAMLEISKEAQQCRLDFTCKEEDVQTDIAAVLSLLGNIEKINEIGQSRL